MSGKKHDTGKAPLELLPPAYWEAVDSPLSHAVASWYFYNRPQLPELGTTGFDVTRVIRHGLDEYGRHNWHAGIRWGRIVGAIHRHANAMSPHNGIWLPISLGTKDADSGLYAGEHVECNLMFLHEYVSAWRNMGMFDNDNDCPWRMKQRAVK